MHRPSSRQVLGNQPTPIDNLSTGVFYVLKSHFQALYIIIGLFGLSLTNCKEKISTPDWSSVNADTQGKTISKDPVVQDDYLSSHRVLENFDFDPNAPVRFVCYNLRNYLTMRRGKEDKFKPEHEIKAIISNLVNSNPDILGVCEIGTLQDLEHLQARLQQAGCHLPFIHLSIGDDPYRRQALLSRFPLKDHKVPKYTFQMKGKLHEVRRGILDVTVYTPKGNIRLLGAHLKSKRPIPVYDQAEIRREEAQILRKHASHILRNNTSKLLVFGDMNDTKGSSTIRLMKGYKEEKLTSLELYDKHGTKWTQYWAKEDIYSRFDYVFASKAVLPMIDQKSSYVLDTPRGDPASDHRALVVLIR